jgi:hypothetical protein
MTWRRSSAVSEALGGEGGIRQWSNETAKNVARRLIRTATITTMEEAIRTKL